MLTRKTVDIVKRKHYSQGNLYKGNTADRDYYTKGKQLQVYDYGFIPTPQLEYMLY